MKNRKYREPNCFAEIDYSKGFVTYTKPVQYRFLSSSNGVLEIPNTEENRGIIECFRSCSAFYTVADTSIKIQ